MTDDDLDLDVEDTAETEPEADTYSSLKDQRLASKLRKEAQTLRARTLEAEGVITSMLEQQYADYTDLIPSELSPAKRLEYARKMSERFSSASSTPSPTETVEDEEPAEVPVPPGLAAVAGAPATPGTSGATLSAAEIRDLMARDPNAGIRAAQAKYGGTNR